MEQSWIVIPTYNEADNVARMINELCHLEIPNLSILIVDDSSPDGTGDIVTKLKSRYLNLHLKSRPQKSGLGRAYVDGFIYAIEHQATQIVQMDADFSHDPSDVLKLLDALAQNDLALGSRYSQGISVVNWPLKRLLISMAGNIYARIITGAPFQDLTGGFKAWRTKTLQDIKINTVKADGYGFQIVTTHRTWKAGRKIVEVPIIFTERREGQSKMNRAIIREAIFLVWKLRLFN